MPTGDALQKASAGTLWWEQWVPWHASYVTRRHISALANYLQHEAEVCTDLLLLRHVLLAHFGKLLSPPNHCRCITHIKTEHGVCISAEADQMQRRGLYLHMVPHPAHALHEGMLVCIAGLAEYISVPPHALCEPLVENHDILVELAYCEVVLILCMPKRRLKFRMNIGIKRPT